MEQQVVDFASCSGSLKPTLRPDRSARRAIRASTGSRTVTPTACRVWRLRRRDVPLRPLFNPPLIEFIYLDAVQVTDVGGDTKWTNLVAAYDALDDATKARIDGLGVRYRLRDGLDFDSYFKASDAPNLADNTEISLVQVNPRTGRKGVWPNTGPDFAADVIGVGSDDGARCSPSCTRTAPKSASCTGTIGASATRASGSTRTMHEREVFPDEQERVLRHVSILGIADPLQQRAQEHAQAG